MMNKELFKDLELDEDTEILTEEYVQIDGLNIKHEYWRWDGVKAHTFVFIAEETSHLNIENIQKIISSNFKDLNTSTYTTKAQGKYKLINCDFETV